MLKIPTLFVRSEGEATEAVTPGCEWVTEGAGEAFRTFDGTPCLIRNKTLYQRFDAFAGTPARGEQPEEPGRPPPAGFLPIQEADPETGFWPGWAPVGDENPATQRAMSELLLMWGPIYSLDGLYTL